MNDIEYTMRVDNLARMHRRGHLAANGFRLTSVGRVVTIHGTIHGTSCALPEFADANDEALAKVDAYGATKVCPHCFRDDDAVVSAALEVLRVATNVSAVLARTEFQAYAYADNVGRFRELVDRSWELWDTVAEVNRFPTFTGENHYLAAASTGASTGDSYRPLAALTALDQAIENAAAATWTDFLLDLVLYARTTTATVVARLAALAAQHPWIATTAEADLVTDQILVMDRVEWTRHLATGEIVAIQNEDGTLCKDPSLPGPTPRRIFLKTTGPHSQYACLVPAHLTDNLERLAELLPLEAALPPSGESLADRFELLIAATC